ncbi:hypothetical protein, partial [Escherichia coli]|uniref:hypothetical protein n=1 Tax=Escherichia coli TaxID=562 RepID=UPI0022B8F1BA
YKSLPCFTSRIACCCQHAYFFHVRGAEVRTVDKADVMHLRVAITSGADSRVLAPTLRGAWMAFIR